MLVILSQVVRKLGKRDQVVKVTGGYARNYLFPNGLATVATKGQLKAREHRMARMQSKLADEKVRAEAIKEKLDNQTIRIEGNVAKDSVKLFGAITSQDIVDLIQKEFGVELDKRQIGLLQPIKRVGVDRIQIDLHQEVDAFINIDVFNPHEPVPTTPEETEEVKTENIEAPAEITEAAPTPKNE